ncbi:hypothetical protein, partial [Mycobacterium sp.]|uniref:hypothetical protein n=1 Tax=Mycobacterium sp. TaxID=1785 RepID=UPI003F952C1A
GRTFSSLDHLNETTAWWLAHVADVRELLEAKQTPLQLHEQERPHLISLPAQASDLLICGILIWSQTRRFGVAGDRIDELQIGGWIGELGRVEMRESVSNRTIGPRVRHRMDLHAKYSLLQIRQ